MTFDTWIHVLELAIVGMTGLVIWTLRRSSKRR